MRAQKQRRGMVVGKLEGAGDQGGWASCGLRIVRAQKAEEMTIWGHLKKMGSPEKPKPIGSTWFRKDVFRGHAEIQFTT